MNEDFAADIEAVQRVAVVRTMLNEICELTGMGFAAVARVTNERWIACQVLDRIEFGLDAGEELQLKTTICDEIRQSGLGVFIDHVAGEAAWRTHHTPALYGFQSYVSVPIRLSDGSFFGTLCTIDPAPREVGLAAAMPKIEAFARAIGRALDVERAGAD